MSSTFFVRQQPNGGKWVVYQGAAWLKGEMEICQCECHWQAESVRVALAAYEARTEELLGRGSK